MILRVVLHGSGAIVQMTTNFGDCNELSVAINFLSPFAISRKSGQ